MVREIVVGAWVCLGISVVTACASDEAPRFCDSLCERIEECDSQATPERCASWCSSAREKLWRARAETLDAIGRCAGGRSCQEVLDGTFLAPCWAQVKPELDVTPRAESFCEAALPKWFECGIRDSVSACVDNMKLWSDRVLDSAQVCSAESDCSVMNRCTNSAFGKDDENE